MGAGVSRPTRKQPRKLTRLGLDTSGSLGEQSMSGGMLSARSASRLVVPNALVGLEQAPEAAAEKSVLSEKSSRSSRRTKRKSDSAAVEASFSASFDVASETQIRANRVRI